MLKIGVILSGCGVNDGSEIHEAVLTLLAIDKAGAQAVCMAPDIPQADVVDHLSGAPTREKRGVLAESARIARGKIQDLRQAKASELDAVIVPGGYGAAKNLCTFAKDGPGCSVQEDVARLLREMHEAGKPIGALCIAPTVLAKVFGPLKPELTIGKDPGTAKALQAMGARHQDRGASEVVVDKANRLVTTPAYMLAGRISEVAAGADALVRAVVELSKKPARA
ncbi:MAG: isoprenoid biosynthesis glyoxalase ElbB [Elusimicrobiota bacterium]